jgi:hypothetical protein
VEFIRWRDLTCRWPGCDAPVFDNDHTIPHPAGPTHPSNIKLYCRAHHLIKTFYCGPGGWREAQSPDGSVTLTAPTGHVYTTEPAGSALFPGLSAPTGRIKVQAGKGDNRGVAMPTRQRSRDQERQARIESERRQRAEINSATAELVAISDCEPPPY